MRFFEKVKDGGPHSPVDGYVLFEHKHILSIILLKFNTGSREEYHSHAFNAVSWFLSGETTEYEKQANGLETVRKSRSGMCLPHFTGKDLFHKYICHKPAWCLTVRGPWRDWWVDGNNILTHTRKIIGKLPLPQKKGDGL